MNVVSRYFIHKSGLHFSFSVSTAIIRFNSDVINGRRHVFRSRVYIHCYFNLLQRPPYYNRPSRNFAPITFLVASTLVVALALRLAIMERFDCSYCCGLSDLWRLWPEAHIMWTFVKRSEFHGKESNIDWTFCRGTGLFSCFLYILKGTYYYL